MAGAAHPLAQPPPPLVEWSDDVLNAIFCRVPFLSHGAARAVCRRVERTQSVARRAAHVAVVRQCRASSEHAVRSVSQDMTNFHCWESLGFILADTTTSIQLC